MKPFFQSILSQIPLPISIELQMRLLIQKSKYNIIWVSSVISIKEIIENMKSIWITFFWYQLELRDPLSENKNKKNQFNQQYDVICAQSSF